MSMIHYLAANRELPLGSFNSTEKNAPDSERRVYKSMEEAAGIYMEKLDPKIYSGEIAKHFKNSNIYVVSPNFGKFFIYPDLKERFEESYNANRKCLIELFKYIRDNICEGEEFEIYSCWTGEESIHDNKVYKVIDLKSFKMDDEFSLDDKEYILIKG
ncbi:hypothetical protein [Acetivibrio clariflavus]|uniref:Uncharacterized protein n=1 Tax=Acetivibrio clariflavus (strain DSM 19732 / NBRC 101661 / EBR45) TaxID=720554 RepID=G8LTF0_ACECE|nr:hypothetical protein [Acetivibrio clariflavus]AEV69445.1 hypothetical protein Clocl_2898 [Acetivibrio clariflavus DSM 19732]